MANTRLENWSSPQIGIVTFVMGMAWIMLFTMNHGVSLQDRIRVLEDKLERTNHLAETLADEIRQRRALPPMSSYKIPLITYTPPAATPHAEIGIIC